MIEKLIESWLTSANERTYQLPFCSALQAQGYVVLSVPSHGPGEHGKDVLARGKGRTYYAFQLKSGNISKRVWQSIRGEVEELVRTPIVYPGVPKSFSHVPILVTNGDVTNDARQSIDDFGRLWARQGHERLQLWQRNQLLGVFLSAHSSLLPSELKSVRDYLQLYVANVKDRLPRERFAGYLLTLVSKETLGADSRRITRGLWNMILLGGYVLEQYERTGNHVSAAEGWAIIAATVLHCCERDRFPGGSCEKMLGIAQAAIERNMTSLVKECSDRPDLLESFGLPLEPFMIGSRTSIVLGWLSAWALIRRSNEEERSTILKVVLRELKNLKVIGECDWPSVICIALFLESFMVRLEKTYSSNGLKC